MTPPAMAPAFDDFFPPLFSPIEVDEELAGFVETDDELECEELWDIETVEGTGASVSGRPPADFAVAGSNVSPT